MFLYPFPGGRQHRGGGGRSREDVIYVKYNASPGVPPYIRIAVGTLRQSSFGAKQITMKAIALLVVLCGVAAADIGLVARGSEPVPIIAQSNVPSVDGRFSWGYESADGTSVNQEGGLEPAQNPQEEPAQTVRGQYSYRADDGREIVVRYVADRFGFRPESEVIAPAIVSAAAAARNLPPLPLDARGRARK